MAEAEILTKLKLEGSQFKGSADAITKSVIGLAAAGTAVSAALAATAVTTAKFQDQTIKAARTVGTTAKEFSALRFAADLAAVGQDNLVKSLAKLNAPTALVKSELKKLNVEFLDAQGRTRDSSLLINDLADAFKDMDRPVERSAAAFKLFGAKGVELVNFLKDGSGAINELKNEAVELGLTFSEKTGAAAENFNDDLVRLQSSMTGLRNSFGTAVIEFVNTSGILQDITDVIVDLRKAFDSIDQDTKELVLQFVALSTGLGAVALGIVAIIKLKPLITAFFKVLAANPVVLALTALAVLIVSIAISIRKNWSQMKNIIDPLSDSFSQLKAIFIELVKPIEDLFKSITSAGDSVKDVGDNTKKAGDEVNIFGTVAKAVFGGVATILIGVIGMIKLSIEFWKLMFDVVKNGGKIIAAVFTLNFDELKNLADDTADKVKNTFSTMKDIVIDARDKIENVWSEPLVLAVDAKKIEEATKELVKLNKKTRETGDTTKAFKTDLENLIEAFVKAKTITGKIIAGANIGKFFADQAQKVVGVFSDLADLANAESQRALEILNRNFEVTARKLAESQQKERDIAQANQKEVIDDLESFFDEELEKLQRSEDRKLDVIQQGADARLLALDEEFQALKELEQEKFEAFLELETIKFEAEKDLFAEKAVDEEQRKINERLLVQDFNAFVEKENVRHDDLLSELQKNFLNDQRKEQDKSNENKIKAEKENVDSIEALEIKRDEALLEAQNNFSDSSLELQREQAADQKSIEKKNLEDNWKAKKEQFEQTKVIRIIEIMVTAAAAAAQVVAELSAQFPLIGTIAGAALAAAIMGVAVARVAQVNDQKPIKPAGLLQRGGVLTGPAHGAGGIPVEAEGGEAFIDKFRTEKFLDKFDEIGRGGSGKTIAITFEEGAIVITGVEREFTEDFLDDLGEALGERLDREGILSEIA